MVLDTVIFWSINASQILFYSYSTPILLLRVGYCTKGEESPVR